MRPELRHSLAVVVGTALVASCSTRPCDSAIDPAAKYQVTLVEPYDSASHFTFDSQVTRMDVLAMGPCAGDGLAAGTAFELRGVGRVDDKTQTCALAKAEPSSLPCGRSPMCCPRRGSPFPSLSWVTR